MEKSNNFKKWQISKISKQKDGQNYRVDTYQSDYVNKTKMTTTITARHTKKYQQLKRNRT